MNAGGGDVRPGVVFVRRQGDGGGTGDNEDAFAECHTALACGDVVAIFPEGTTHDRPRIDPLKTGAARIALAANAMRGTDEPAVPVVPVGLHYTAKGRFRSDALVTYGAPIEVARVALDDGFEFRFAEIEPAMREALSRGS